MNKASFVFLLVCVATALQAQTEINPVMRVSNLSNSETPMRLDDLSIDIKVVGQVAVTTLDMTFFNDNGRTMEGSFEFPLADGQTITRFALDLNGSLREGVVVNKAKGRQAFEAIVRRGVDPGLVEKTAGNNFRMRIFPLPAKGSRRVVLAFEQRLSDKGAFDSYSLPLRMNQPIRNFKVRAEIFKKEVAQDTTDHTRNRLIFDKQYDAWVATFERIDFTPVNPIAFEFPHQQIQLSNRQDDLTEITVYQAPFQTNKDSSFFYLTIRPNAKNKIEKALPKRLVLLWDVSGSGNNRNIQKELQLLGSYLQRIRNVSIEFIPFHIRANQSKYFQIENGRWTELKKTLENLVYDGGTALGSIDLTNLKCDEILLFTDGLTTIGEPETLPGKIPVNAILSSVVADPDCLRSLAQKSGGVFVNLQKSNIDEALDLMTFQDFHFISAKMESGFGKDIVPSMPCSFDKTLSVSGICKANQGSLRLNFGFGNTITYSKLVPLKSNHTMDATLIHHIWASMKIDELNLNKTKNADKIEKLAKTYGIVTDQTSLIVLENLSDYLENDILPPIEMQQAYQEAKARMNQEETVRLKDRLEEVVNASNLQTVWWNTNYPIVPKKKKKRSQRSTVRFTAPVISDEAIEEGEQIQSQEELSTSRATISVATVRGTDEERGVDIADLEDSHTLREVGTSIKRSSSILLNAWDPETPYYKVLQYAAPAEAFHTYLRLKQEYGSTPSFYIDAADYFMKAGYRDTALVILTNLAELNLEAPQLLRALGNKLMEYGQYAFAVSIYRKLLRLRSEDPQSYRDLGLAYNANKQYQEAIETLYKVITNEWDDRFDGIDMIVMNEINNIVHARSNLDYSFIDRRLIKREPVDIRVCLTWDTDNSDMDLWVTDPAQEKCFFSHQRTRLGGKITNDMTEGLGPEEFMIKKAVAGKYQVQANYYGTRSQALLAPVNLHLVFYTNYGKSNQVKKEVTLRLNDKKEVIDIGSFVFKPKQ